MNSEKITSASSSPDLHVIGSACRSETLELPCFVYALQVFHFVHGFWLRKMMMNDGDKDDE